MSDHPQIQLEEEIEKFPLPGGNPIHVEGLSAFGIDPSKAPDTEQWSRLCKVVKALVTNPHIIVGDDSSETIFPTTVGTSKESSSTVAAATGSFRNQYVDDDGHTYLQGGSVTGGNGGSATIADLKVVDGTTGITGTEGNILYAEVTCNATVEDGIMLPGCEVTAATTNEAATLPDNEQFTAAAYTGKKLYIELGRWNADEFLPAAAGNLHAAGCIGNFSITRV